MVTLTSGIVRVTETRIGLRQKLSHGCVSYLTRPILIRVISSTWRTQNGDSTSMSVINVEIVKNVFASLIFHESVKIM